jgi:glycine betaine/proline transport system ATP-binding protein
MSIIKVKNLYKVFGKEPKEAMKMVEEGYTKDEIMEKTGNTVGINNVSFEVKPGESFVVMGLSGSGKSTLIRCLNRLIEATSGAIYINDKDITKMDKQELTNIRKTSVNMVFQNFAIFPHKTVLENASYGLKVRGMAKEEREQKGRESLDNVGLKGWEDYYPSNLSGGMQQRVGLARALATDPEILLMDEAFSALDPLIRKDMQTELIELQDRLQKTIVFITHDLDEALRVGDRIALMKDGEIVQIGTPEEIMMSPATDYVEKFVEDVDRSRVLTAEMLMKKTTTVVRYPKDGPRVALHRMNESDISSIFVLDKQSRLIGIVMAEDALKAVENRETSLDSIIQKDIPKALPDTPVKEMFALLTGKNLPLAVVDENEKLQGIIVRGTVMAKLAEGGTENV